jgi:PAS domain S-box-containing protein
VKFEILLIEDNSTDAKQIAIYLRQAYNGDDYNLTKAKSLKTGLELIANKSFSVILLDLSLPDSVGLNTFRRIFEKVPTTPIIVLSAYINETVGLKTMKMGAQDFFIKGKLHSKELRRSINYSIDRNKLLKQLSEKTKKLEEKTFDLIKEKAKLSLAQKLAHIGSWEWNINHNTLIWSEELYEIYGLKPEEFNNTSEEFLEKVHVEDRKFTKEIIESAYMTLEPFNFYHRIVRPDNEVRMIHAIGNVTKDENGNASTMYGTGQDVTEQIHEEELEKLATAATKSFNSVIIANKKGEIEWVNDSFTRLSGYTLQEIKQGERALFKIINDIISQREKKSNKNNGKKIPASYERECFTKGGKRYWVISTITPVLDENGEIERIIIIDTDITQRKHIEEELVRTNSIKEQFLANMSHEIRTPMNAIVGFTDLLLKTDPTPEQKQYIDAVKTSGRNLIVIINDILDFSKIGSGKITFEQIEFDLRHLISTLTELMLPKSMEKNIRISTKIDRRVPSQLVGDPTRLNQILLNLVGNAIKFTEKGGVTIVADFVSENKENIQLRFSVIDTGIGIPQNKQAYIFEGFTQATNDTNRKYGGTGLGLTIVKQLVELQGGTIAVQSRVDSGSRFILNFKFKKTLPENVVPGKLFNKKIELPNVERLNVLLVEDNTLNQILAKKVLTNWNWNVDVADNGLIAVQKVKNHMYDIILMDIQMPEMDGYETTQYIRERTSLDKRNIPIIAITAHAISGEAEKCYMVGMNDYLSKPFDEKILYEKIITAVKKNNIPKVSKRRKIEKWKRASTFV